MLLFGRVWTGVLVATVCLNICQFWSDVISWCSGGGHQWAHFAGFRGDVLFFFHHHEIFICAQCTGHVLQSQCTGCYPAQCSKIDMATSNFLLGQKYGIQVVRNDPVLLWPLILFVNSASDGWSCHLFTRWTRIQLFSFMHDLLPGLGTIQRPMPLQVNIQRDFLRNFYLDQSDLWEVHWYIQNL